MNQVYVPRRATPDAISMMLKLIKEHRNISSGRFLIAFDKCSDEYMTCVTCPCPEQCRDLYNHLLFKKQIKWKRCGKYD